MNVFEARDVNYRDGCLFTGVGFANPCAPSETFRAWGNFGNAKALASGQSMQSACENAMSGQLRVTYAGTKSPGTEPNKLK